MIKQNYFLKRGSKCFYSAANPSLARLYASQIGPAAFQTISSVFWIFGGGELLVCVIWVILYINDMTTVEGRSRTNSRSQKNKFMIKVRVASRENQENREEVQEEVERATDEDARQFIDYMIERSHRLKEMLDRKGIHHEQAFYQKHLINSVCLKTILKQVLDKMMTDRRLGKNLKGMNKSNLIEIENNIWNIIEREASLYLGELDYQRQKKQLMGELTSRKKELLEQIEKLTCLRECQQDNFMLTSHPQ